MNEQQDRAGGTERLALLVGRDIDMGEYVAMTTECLSTGERLDENELVLRLRSGYYERRNAELRASLRVQVPESCRVSAVAPLPEIRRAIHARGLCHSACGSWCRRIFVRLSEAADLIEATHRSFEERVVESLAPAVEIIDGEFVWTSVGPEGSSGFDAEMVAIRESLRDLADSICDRELSPVETPIAANDDSSIARPPTVDIVECLLLRQCDSERIGEAALSIDESLSTTASVFDFASEAIEAARDWELSAEIGRLTRELRALRAELQQHSATILSHLR